MQWPHISSRGPETHSFSVQFQVIFSSCFNFSSQLYDIYLVNIYLNILKYITNIYVCQRLEFVVVFWCLLNCLLFQIMLHKFAEISLSLSLSLSLCVMSAPSHCYAFIFCAFYLPKSNKCPGHLGHVCVCVCVCVSVCARACVRACVSASVNKLVAFVLQYQSFIYEWKFSQLCQICWFYKPLSNKMHSIAVTHMCVCVYACTHEIECSFQFAFVL